MSLEGSTAALVVACASALLSGAGDVQPQSRGARVTVSLAVSGARKLSNAAVVMTRDGTPGSVVEPPTSGVVVLPDGSFVFSDVPPGAYRVRAHAGTSGTSTPLIAVHRIVVDSRDVSVTLSLAPGASVSGRLTAEGVNTAAPATFAGLQVEAPFADGAAETAVGDVMRNGSFTIRGLTPGRHVISLDGLAAPWVLHQVTFRGRDITDGGFEADSGQWLDDVRITITDATTDVSGTVRDSKGESVPGAAVLIIPAAPEFRTPSSRRFGRTTTDGAGRFRYRGLPPGEYRVVAAVLDDADIYQPELLRRLSDAGEPLMLAPLATPVMDLRLTPATVPSAAAR
jgi:hypothetical protein